MLCISLSGQWQTVVSTGGGGKGTDIIRKLTTATSIVCLLCARHCAKHQHALSFSTLKIALQGRYYYYPRFVDEETEA